MFPIELRSDTFTRPTPGMRQAIAEAEVGDDMVGEDPTVNRLEARMAELFGKEAAVFACSGIQSNQMAIWAHCSPGEELLIESSGHIANFEAGSPAVLSGVSVRRIPGQGGKLDVPDLEDKISRGNLHFAYTRLLCIENSTNIGGGQTYSMEQIKRVTRWAAENELIRHLDGARIFNACHAQGYQPHEVAQHFETISVCFSKGLGCPVGSILIGSQETIQKARKARKIFGGALRQAGILAAACLYALDHHRERLVDDHQNAKRLARGLVEIPGISIDPGLVETNLLFFEVDPQWGTAAQLSAALKQKGVNLNPAGGKYRLRACTHLDVTAEQIDETIRIVRDCLNESAA